MTTDTITNEQDRERYISDVRSMELPFTGSLKMGSGRTSLQNRAMHKWFRLCADFLNDSGITMHVFFDELIEDMDWLDADWTETGFKEKVWKPFQQAMLDKESTTELDTKEPSVICMNITRAIAEKTGVTLPPWPSRFGY